MTVNKVIIIFGISQRYIDKSISNKIIFMRSGIMHTYIHTCVYLFCVEKKEKERKKKLCKGPEGVLYLIIN